MDYIDVIGDIAGFYRDVKIRNLGGIVKNPNTCKLENQIEGTWNLNSRNPDIYRWLSKPGINPWLLY